MLLYIQMDYGIFDQTCSACHFLGNGHTFKEDNFVKIVLPPFWKEVYSKREEFTHTGSKLFPFRRDPFSEVLCSAGKQ